MSCIFGENRDIFFPKLSESLHLISFSDIAVKYLKNLGYEPYLCKTEYEAREFFLIKTEEEIKNSKQWPCFFTSSDTTGEKDFEEFFTDNEVLDMNSFKNIGVIKNEAIFDSNKLNNFENRFVISALMAGKTLESWFEDVLLLANSLVKKEVILK